MTAPSGSDAGTTGDRHRFRRLLLELKREGCRVLVSGDVGASVRATRSRQLFGRAENRHRILASTDLGEDAIRNYLPETVSADGAAVDLLRLGDIRSVSVAETYSTPPPRRGQRVRGVPMANRRRHRAPPSRTPPGAGRVARRGGHARPARRRAHRRVRPRRR